MNTPKILAAGILAATAILSTASAVDTIYITGSTAFRSVTNAQISALLSGTVTIASTNATLGKANGATWTGGNIGGTAVTIKAAWTGSAAGIQTVAGNSLTLTPAKFLKVGATGTGNPDPNGSSPDSPESAIPDVCMADNLQSSTVFTGGSLINGGPSTYLSLTDAQVGVVAFTWAASNGFPAGKSMSQKLADQLLGNSAIPLGALTAPSRIPLPPSRWAV